MVKPFVYIVFTGDVLFRVTRERLLKTHYFEKMDKTSFSNASSKIVNLKMLGIIFILILNYDFQILNGS